MGDAGAPRRVRAELGLRAAPFSPRATARVREQAPGFCFVSEVYLDLEWTLQQQGFDYTYDKRLFVTLPFGDLAGAEWRLTDQIEEAVYDRDGGDLQTRGLYVDATPWQASGVHPHQEVFGA